MNHLQTSTKLKLALAGAIAAHSFMSPSPAQAGGWCTQLAEGCTSRVCAKGWLTHTVLWQCPTESNANYTYNVTSSCSCIDWPS